MENETILITGSSGLVGSYLIPELISRYKYVFATTHITRTRSERTIQIDLSQSDLLRKALEKIKPTIIINLAAFTDVDGCERNREYAIRLNTTVPKIISEYIRKKQLRRDSAAYFLHVSTDYVFDGNGGNYKEESEPNPINWYGRTKLHGEEQILRNLEDDGWCIARISTPFGVHPKKQSFPSFIINKVRNGETVNVVKDQYTSPSYSLDLAKMFLEIMERRITHVMHVASSSRLSRYEQAMKIAEVFNLESALIHDCSSESMKWLASRPKDSSLDVSRASESLKNKPRDFDQGLSDFFLEFGADNRKLFH
jgi:dTDP-4-dehydrorhamnose reductase